MKKLLLLLAICSLFAIPKSYAGDTAVSEIITDEGLSNAQTWIDVPTASSHTFTALGIRIATATLVSGGTTLVDGAAYAVGGSNTFLQVTFPRNVVCDVEFLLGEATTTVSGSLIVDGLNARNQETRETIAVTTNSATGNEAWAFISTFTLSGFTISGACGTNNVSTCTVHIGTGNKLGLGDDIRASTDVYKVTIDYVDLSTTSYTINGADATYDILDTSKSQIPDASKDYRIWLKALKNH